MLTLVHPHSSIGPLDFHAHQSSLLTTVGPASPKGFRFKRRLCSFVCAMILATWTAAWILGSAGDGRWCLAHQNATNGSWFQILWEISYIFHIVSCLFFIPKRWRKNMFQTTEHVDMGQNAGPPEMVLKVLDPSPYLYHQKSKVHNYLFSWAWHCTLQMYT